MATRPAAMSMDAWSAFSCGDGCDRSNDMQYVGCGRRGHVDGDTRDAELNRPFGICVLDDAHGTLAFTDAHNNAVRLVIRDECAGRRGRCYVKTIENTGLLTPKGIGASSDGRHLFVCDTGHHKIKLAALPGRSALAEIGEVSSGVEMFAFAGNGKKGWRDGPVLDCSFNAPTGVCECTDSTIIVADTGNHCIRQIRRVSNGKLVVKTIAGGCAYSRTSEKSDLRLSKRNSGHRDGLRALFRSPSGIIAGAHGEILVADTMNNCIRGLLPPMDGKSPWKVRTVCGQTRPGFADGGCETTLFNQPVDLCWGKRGASQTFFVSDKGNACIRQVGRSYERVGDCLSYSWVRTIELETIPRTPRAGPFAANREMHQCSYPLGVTCLAQPNTGEEDPGGVHLVVCDGGENIIKLLPLQKTGEQVLNMERQFFAPKREETRAASSTFPTERLGSGDCAVPEDYFVTEAPSSKGKRCASEDCVSENQFENDQSGCSCGSFRALARALEANAALQSENSRLKELLQCTFDEIEQASKRLSTNRG